MTAYHVYYWIANLNQRSCFLAYSFFSPLVMIDLMFIATGQKLWKFSKSLQISKSIQTLFILLVIVNIGLVLCAVLKKQNKKTDCSFCHSFCYKLGIIRWVPFFFVPPPLWNNFPFFIQVAHLETRMNLTSLSKK